MIGRFCSQEERSKPERVYEWFSVCVRNAFLHDVLGMPIHYRILEIESFQIGDPSGFDLFREAKVAT
jgi:hypothetical protein